MSKLQRAVIDRPYSSGFATVGALYERSPRISYCVPYHVFRMRTSNAKPPF